MRRTASTVLMTAPLVLLLMGAGLCRSGRGEQVDPKDTRTAAARTEDTKSEASTALLLAPDPPPPADVTVRIHSGRDVHPISPYVYGTNNDEWDGKVKGLPFGRLGGNRWTGYNWENNASHAGTDWHNQNDSWLRGGNKPGEAIRMRMEAAHDTGAAMLVTVPIVGIVAADKDGDGDVADTSNYLERRFLKSKAQKGAAFEYPPDPDDGVVYQDELVHYLETTCEHDRTKTPIFYSLDNEPALWASTHPRMHPEPATYQEVIDRSIEFAIAIKRQAPDTLVFGPASYGWMGIDNLQKAKDRKGRMFLPTYLKAMREAEARLGKRLLDVLDVHWYPSPEADGERISGRGYTPGIVGMRLQNPRSLWDPSYIEDSWITKDVLMQPLRLIPRLKEMIDENYPGTRLAVTEYNFGGGGHISGGIAQADVLGVFGREGVFAASIWDLARGEDKWQYAGFRMFTDYDGAGSAFGDTSIHASTTDVARTSVYASVDEGKPGRMVVVAINKTVRPLPTAIVVTHSVAFEGAEVYQLTSAAPMGVRAGRIEPVGQNTFEYTLPPMSVSTLELR